jgi:hypothetical protein
METGTSLPFILIYVRSRDSSVGIATRYGLEGPGIESRWERDSPHTSEPAVRPTQPPIQWVPGVSRGVKRPGRGVNHPPPSRKSNSYTSTPSLGLRGPLEGDLYLSLYNLVMFRYAVGCYLLSHVTGIQHSAALNLVSGKSNGREA